jgi:hypothetical protein
MTCTNPVLLVMVPANCATGGQSARKNHVKGVLQRETSLDEQRLKAHLLSFLIQLTQPHSACHTSPQMQSVGVCGWKVEQTCQCRSRNKKTESVSRSATDRGKQNVDSLKPAASDALVVPFLRVSPCGAQWIQGPRV